MEEYKKFYRNNKFKISGETWDEVFELSDGSYSVPDIQNYFKYTNKKHETLADEPSIQIYVNKIQNRVIFKIKYGTYLELLTPETMKLLGKTEGNENYGVLSFAKNIGKCLSRKCKLNLFKITQKCGQRCL